MMKPFVFSHFIPKYIWEPYNVCCYIDVIESLLSS